MDGRLFQRDGAKRTGSAELEHGEGGVFTTGNTETRRRPAPLPKEWKQLVDRPQSEGELQALRRSVLRGQPYGGERWVKSTTKRLGLESTFRPRGRPKGS